MNKSKLHISKIFPALACLILLLSFSLSSHAQVNTFFIKGATTHSIEISFVNEEIEIVKGEIISNVLKIKNTSSDSLKVYISLNQPPLWKTLFISDRMYAIPDNDSIFIPVRIIPAAMMKGDTKYYINAFIENENREQIAGAYFFASTERISRWDMIANPDQRIYFKNDENTAGFDLSLTNTGNEKQDLLMTMSNIKSSLIVMDSNDKPQKVNKWDFSLEPEEDTTLSYRVKYTEGQRNFKNIDIENYNPESLNEEKHFSLFFHSEEPRRINHSNTSRNTKIDFIKLQSEKKVNPFGSDVLPLSAYLRVTNLLDDVVFSSLHLRGQKSFNNGGNLFYNTSMYFSSQSNFYGENYIKNIPWYIGYFDNNKSFQIGNVNGGALGVQSSGKGAKGEIKFLPNQWGGGYYVRSPYIFEKPRLESWGLHHRLELDNFTNLTQYSHSHHYSADIITDVISVAPKLRLKQKHTITFTGALSNRQHYADPNNRFNKQGYLVGAGYTSNFFERRWKLNLRGSYTSKGFGSYGFERWFANHRSRVSITKDFELSMINNYNHYRYDKDHYNYIAGYNKNYYFFNSLNFHSARYFPNLKPGIFYDIKYGYGYNFHVTGLNLAYSKYDITRNLQMSFNSMLGMSRIVNEPDSKSQFVCKLNTMIRYHNFSFTGFYNYGPYSPAMVHYKEQNNIIPQNVRVSLIHQYLFKNRHLVLQSMVSYGYVNMNNHHSVNISPELYYFTNSGWRISINPAYTYYSSKFSTNYNDLPSYVGYEDWEFQRYSHDNFLVSVGVKKDFGIPIPTTYNRYANMSFVAFYDLNGNNVQDEDEPGLGNIVIQVGDWSIITKSNGRASLKNVDPGNFEYSVLSLENLKGWFPMINDSLKIFKDELINIPFVKGVKIYGSVYIDQEDLKPMEDKKLDISGIKISATNGHTFNTLTGSDGGFEFYMPFGEYTISLDENILNGRYYLVQNNYKVDLTGQVDNLFITFHILEKKRKVKIKRFDDNGEEIDE